jgi:hypothetical protein
MTLKKYDEAPTQPELIVAQAADGGYTLTYPEGAAAGGGCSVC